MLETRKARGAILEEYVYVFVDTRKPGKFSYTNIPFSCLYEPFYVGKGSGDRALYHIKESSWNTTTNPHKTRKINLIKEETGEDPNFFMFQCDSAENAFSMEELCIETIGRSCINLGPLTNITKGGLGNRGVPTSEETKEKISSSMKEYLSTLSEDELSDRCPTKGRKRTDEERENIRQSRLGWNPSEEARKNMSKSHKDVPLSKEHAKHISEALKGKPHSKEWNEKVGNALRGKPKSEEHKQKLREASLRYHASKKKQSS